MSKILAKNRLNVSETVYYTYFKCFISIFLVSSILSAQSFTRELNTIQFFVDENPLNNIFSGGHNNLEIQFLDWDSDNDLDIVFLDSDGSFGVYLNIGSSNEPVFKLKMENTERLFIKNWFYFADMDNDTDYDYFTNGESNLVKYFMNIGTSTLPVFELINDTLKSENNIPVFSESGSNPVFIDIDNDGDYDLLSGNQTGAVTLYKNTGNNKQFNFEFETDSWQDILIIGGTEKVLSTELHGASSIEFGDITGNDSPELLWGDFFSRSLYFFSNNGTLSEPDLSLTSSVFPINSDSVFTKGFNMPRLADIDDDGDKDLFVSVLFDPTVTQSLTFYENIGSENQYEYRLTTKDYLNSLDVGTKSAPTFIDIDDDNDLDLFIGNEKNPFGSISFFQNDGTATNPIFSLIDSNYFNIRGDLSIAPCFGDLDGDGDFDLLVGKLIKTIDHYENIGSKTNPNFVYRGILKNSNGEDIEFGNFIRPVLNDLDADGDLDLILGGSNGQIMYLKNNGDVNQYEFEEDTSVFNEVEVGNNSSPTFADLDMDNDFDLFIGNRSGSLYFFENTGSATNPLFSFNTQSFLEINFGAEILPIFVDIESDSDFDLFIGNLRGGLLFYRNNSITSVETTETINENLNPISVYPNPFNNSVNISGKVPINSMVTVEVFDILGRKVKTIWKSITRNSSLNLYWNGINDDNKKLTSGIYIISVQANNSINSLPIILLK
jgi:hypothetical protein